LMAQRAAAAMNAEVSLTIEFTTLFY
jgi:hypothetical protein